MTRTILLAEDDPNDVLLFEWALKSTGLSPKVQLAANGQDVIQYLSRCGAGEGAPELVFLDLKMPRVNGFEVLEWLNEQADLPRPVVVVLSGSTMPSDLIRARELGAKRYLEKPITADLLRELLSAPGEEWERSRRAVQRRSEGASR